MMVVQMDTIGNPEWCGGYDDSDFTSNEMCCACGGGEDIYETTPYVPYSPYQPAKICVDTNDDEVNSDGYSLFLHQPTPRQREHRV